MSSHSVANTFRDIFLSHRTVNKPLARDLAGDIEAAGFIVVELVFGMIIFLDRKFKVNS